MINGILTLFMFYIEMLILLCDFGIKKKESLWFNSDIFV